MRRDYCVLCFREAEGEEEGALDGQDNRGTPGVELLNCNVDRVREVLIAITLAGNYAA